MTDPALAEAVEPTANDTSDIALVLRNAQHHFKQAAHTLRRIRRDYGEDVLLRVDLFADPPALVLCLLHFAPHSLDDRVMTELQELARMSALRVLKLSSLTPDRREDFYQRQLGRFAVQELEVADMDTALAVVEGALRDAMAQDQEALACPRLERHFVDVDAFLAAYSGRSTDPDLFLDEVGDLIEGQRVTVQLRVGERLGPIELSARIQHVGGNPANTGGMRLGLRLLLPPTEQIAWEAFLIAAMRNESWPGLSGRRYERFPVELRVDYTVEQEPRREVVRNLSRGGFFLDSFDPPPLGETLDLALYTPGSEQPTMLRGRVVWSRRADRAGSSGLPVGAGIEFVDDPQRIDEAVSALLQPFVRNTVRRVLLADDDRFYRALLGHTLHLAGLAVLQATDGDEAFRLVLDELMDLDLIVLDLYMPGMPVPELLEAIRDIRTDRQIPVLVVTGAEVEPALQQSLAALGVRAVLSKTASGEVLLKKIEDVLAG
ncbi:MAG: response regulator [Pseudomonadota bacterium]